VGKKEINTFISIGILLSCLTAVLFISSLKRAPARDVRILSFPMELAGWQGADVEFKDKEYLKRVYEILGTDKVLIRSYRNSEGEKVLIQVVYSDQKRQSFHPPEYCYLGSGNNEMLYRGKVNIDLSGKEAFSANESVYRVSRNKVLMLDWYTSGDVMTGNYYKQQLFFVLNQFKHAKSGGSAVRVWTVVSGDDEAGALERCKKFIKEVVKVLPDYL
jgi:EpsI family protein